MKLLLDLVPGGGPSSQNRAKRYRHNSIFGGEGHRGRLYVAVDSEEDEGPECGRPRSGLLHR